LDPQQTEVWIQALRSHHLIPNQALSLVLIHGSVYQKKKELGMDPIHRVHLCEFGAIWYQISHKSFAQEKQQIFFAQTI